MLTDLPPAQAYPLGLRSGRALWNASSAAFDWPRHTTELADVDQVTDTRDEMSVQYVGTRVDEAGLIISLVGCEHGSGGTTEVTSPVQSAIISSL